MKSKIVGLAILVGLVSMTGCAGKSGNENLGKMETSQIEAGITKGKSTKADVKTMLGDPDKTDFDNNSLEKWTYIHVRSDLKAVNYVPVVNWFVRGTNDTTKSLVVIFDENGVVKNYINSDAKGETKAGLLQ